MVDSLRINVRKAKMSDREAVLQFTEHTYEWGDYIPMVWDRWFAEPGSEMLIATVKGKPVSILHFVMISREEAWFEGMRVDAGCRRLGIAKRVIEYAIRKARLKGARILRFITASDNTPVHHMAAGLGFTRVASIITFYAKALPPRNTLQQPADSEMQAVDLFIRNSAVFKAMSGLFGTGWRFGELTPSFIQEKLHDGMGRQIVKAGALEAFAFIEMRMGLDINFIDGSPAALKKLVRGLRGEVSNDSEHPGVRAHLPDNPEIRSKMISAGLKPMDDEPPFWIYELNVKA